MSWTGVKHGKETKTGYRVTAKTIQNLPIFVSIFQARPKNITNNQSFLITNVKNTNFIRDKDY